MTVMAADLWPDQDRVLTVEDMLDMPDDEYRYELDGEHPAAWFMRPGGAPPSRYGSVSVRTSGDGGGRRAAGSAGR